jgi:hypothetical protein
MSGPDQRKHWPHVALDWRVRLKIVYKASYRMRRGRVQLERDRRCGVAQKGRSILASKETIALRMLKPIEHLKAYSAEYWQLIACGMGKWVR